MNTAYPFDSLDALRRDIETPGADLDELRARLAAMGRTIIRRESQPKVDALMAAGWSLVLPEGREDPEPFEWQWRRPGKRGGRLFRSTGQAYAALERGKASGQSK